ncbi:MAG: DUF4419 domain-containing protein [Nitrospira sp. LK70]|nr:DUF4419 domain-containing protein [Nitrospira sp. LK70]
MTPDTIRLIDPALIVHRSEKDICFRVDDVVPSPIGLPLTHARQQLEKRLARPVQALIHEQASDIVLEKHGMEHSLVQAVYLAFSQHRPLVLTPDAIWITLAQGFAHHLNAHGEALRSRLVAHKGKVTLEALTLELASTQDWAAVIQQWSTKIQSHIPAELYQLMLCEFSTTTPIIRTASQVVMLDAFQQYFHFVAVCICGIPTITVKGTMQDWVRIRERVDVMAGYYLDWWTDRLKPVCDAFIETVQGHPSETFWKHIYSPKEVYGGELITGWLADLFPYIKDPVTASPTVRNPILTIPRKQLTSDRGLSPKNVPTGLSCAPFTLKFDSDRPPKQMELIAGFIGVKQEVDTGQLEPEIGWAVLEEDESSRAFTLLASATRKEKTKQEDATTCMAEHSYGKYAGIVDSEMPEEFVRLMHTYKNGQIFYSSTSHPWVLKSRSNLAPRQVWSSNFRIVSPAVHFMDLADGRAIAYVSFALKRFKRPSWWIIVGKPDAQTFHLDSVMVIAEGFLQFLQRLTEANGSYYFDDPCFQPDVVLCNKL